MMLRLLRQYQGWAPGSVVDFPAGVAELLLKRHIACPADPIAERPPRNRRMKRKRVRRKAIAQQGG